MNGRCNINTISHIQDSDATFVRDPSNIEAILINYFKSLSNGQMNKGDFSGMERITKKKISNEKALDLTKEVSKDEIEKTIFSLPNDKSPGPNGFDAFFFKRAWSIMHEDVVSVIKSFFSSSKLLREINCTSITLVPKCTNPSSCNDFRPISCCNTIYKCITKILANKIKPFLPNIIDYALLKVR